MQTSAMTIFQVFLFKGVKCINHNFKMWSCKNDVSLFMYLLPRMVVIFFPFKYFMFPPLPIITLHLSLEINWSVDPVRLVWRSDAP